MEKELSLKEIFERISETIRFLFKKWLTIVGFSLLFAVLGLIYAMMSPIKYKAQLTFVIEEEGAKTQGGLSSLASSFGLGGMGGGTGLFASVNIIDFLKSRNVIEKTLLEPIGDSSSSISFAQYYINKAEWSKQWEGHENKELKTLKYKPFDDRSKFSRTKDSVLYVIYRTIVESELVVANQDEDNTILLVEMENIDETFAQRFVVNLINVVSEYYTESKTKKSALSVSIFQQQADSVRKELYSSMAGAAASSDQVFGLNPAMNIKRLPSSQKQVDVQANTIILAELLKNLELAKMNLMNQTPLIQVIDKPILPLKEVKFRKLYGIIIGGILGGFLIVSYFLVKRFLKKVKES